MSCSAAATTNLPRVRTLSLLLIPETSFDYWGPTPKPAILPNTRALPEGHSLQGTASTLVSLQGKSMGTDEPLCSSSCQTALT